MMPRAWGKTTKGADAASTPKFPLLELRSQSLQSDWAVLRGSAILAAPYKNRKDQTEPKIGPMYHILVRSNTAHEP